MNNKNIIGNGSKATLPNGKKMEDFKKPPTFNNQGASNKQNTSDPDQSNVQDKKNADNGENKKSKADQVGGQVASEALKKSLKAAFPYIPQFIINKLVDSKAGQEVIQKSLQKVKKKMIWIGIGIVGTLLMWLFTISMFFSLIAGPVAFINDALSGIGAFFTSLGHWFAGDGWCSTSEECQANAQADYYDDLKIAVEKYNGSCSINEDLITATIFYGQMVSEEGLELDEDGKQGTDHYNYVDISSEQPFKQSAKSQINKLIRVYLKGESLSADELSAEDDSEITDNVSCSKSSKAYRQYLIDTYIDWAYHSVINEKRTKEVIADDILRMGNIALINRAYSSSIYCPSIAVEQENGTVESMDLETYVARVVSNENSWYEGDNIENMKAQAVVARTYALNYTKNCQNSIKNSTSTQTLSTTPNNMAIRAAEETNSLVLLKDGSVFSAQYDALAIDHEDSENYYLKQANLAISKSWLDSKLSSSQFEYYANHNHGQGMSQWGSRYLQSIGKSYSDILTTFYTFAEITKMGGMISGGNYSSNIGPAADIYELADRRDQYSGDLNIYSSSASNVSQCPWYAKSRAIEIVYGSNMEDDLKNMAIQSLRNTGGNGADWYKNPDSTIFTKVADYTQPQAGSIVSWSTSKADGCSHEYGHVAIIEQVMENGNVLISDSYNNGGADSGNSWSKVAYRVYEKPLSYIQQHTSGKCVYRFNGYVYLLG